MRRRVLSLALLSAAACGVGEEQAPRTYYDFAMAQSQIVCEAQLRCCGVPCSTAADSSLVRSTLDTQRYIDAGRLRISPAAMQECLFGHRARHESCDALVGNLPDLPSACGSVVIGTFPLGSACEPVGQNLCVPGSYCDGLRRSCIKYLGSGESCMSGRCGPGLYCDTAARTCNPLPKGGESCANSMSCDGSTAKLVCLPAMVCGTPLPDGQPCMQAAQCQSGICISTCVPATTPPRTVRYDLCRTLR